MPTFRFSDYRQTRPFVNSETDISFATFFYGRAQIVLKRVALSNRKRHFLPAG